MMRYLSARLAQQVCMNRLCLQHLAELPFRQIDEELMSTAGAFSIDQVTNSNLVVVVLPNNVIIIAYGIGWPRMCSSTCHSLPQGFVSSSSRLLWARKSRFVRILCLKSRELIFSPRRRWACCRSPSWYAKDQTIARVLVCDKALGMFGYRPTVYMPKVCLT